MLRIKKISSNSFLKVFYKDIKTEFTNRRQISETYIIEFG